jgi:hypothetical protein
MDCRRLRNANYPPFGCYMVAVFAILTYLLELITPMSQMEPSYPIWNTKIQLAGENKFGALDFIRFEAAFLCSCSQAKSKV